MWVVYVFYFYLFLISQDGKQVNGSFGGKIQPPYIYITITNVNGAFPGTWSVCWDNIKCKTLTATFHFKTKHDNDNHWLYCDKNRYNVGTGPSRECVELYHQFCTRDVGDTHCSRLLSRCLIVGTLIYFSRRELTKN